MARAGTGWSTSAYLPGPNIGVGHALRGDEFSLAAFGATAITVFAPLPDRQNHSEILYYNYPSDKFFAQELDNANDGTGKGGRRSIRSFPLRPPFNVGDGTRIFFNAAQDVLEATGIDLTGRLEWKDAVRASNDPVHSDFWDIIPDEETGFWLATDGGVYRRDGSISSFNDGLATHHIHTLSAMFGKTARGSDTVTDLAYATSDNDAWFKSGSAPWSTYGKLGDANWTAADRGNPTSRYSFVTQPTPSSRTLVLQAAGSKDVGGMNSPWFAIRHR